jgi:hypothetical protein
MCVTNPQAMKGPTMDDDYPHPGGTPGVTRVDASDDGQEEREARFRATAARVRAQAVKAAATVRPHLGPIATTFVTVAIPTLVSYALDRSRPNDRALSPSPSCRPASGGPSSTCLECGRPLTDELSRQAGYGPTCARYRLL